MKNPRRAPFLALSILGVLTTMNLSSCGPIAKKPRAPGLYASLKILGEESTPIHWENEEKETCYLASSFLDLELEFSFVPPEGSEATFQGDCMKFTGKFINASYSYNEDQIPLYRLHFNTAFTGNYRLDYSFEDYAGHLNFVVDDDSDSWKKYRTSLKEVVPWAKTLEKSEIESIRFEFENASSGPSSFRRIDYAKEEQEIDKAYSYLDSILYSTNQMDLIAPGTGNTHLTYLLSNSRSETLRFTGRYFTFEGHDYRIKDTYSSPENPLETRYGFQRYGNNIHAVKTSDSSSTPIDYLYDLEFVKWPSEDSYDENSPVIYQIEGYVGESIEVYSATRFQYQNRMYQIRSTKNFSSLF